MSVKSMIKCNCGQRIVARDVMQTGYYLRLFGPSFVYVKFRCSRCKKLGEQFVKQDEWEDGILKDIPSEMKQDQRQNLAGKGPITLEEVVDFHYKLEESNSIKELVDSIEVTSEAGVEAQEDGERK